MGPDHELVEQRGDQAGEEDAVEEIPVELHDLVLAVLEQVGVGEAGVFLRADVEMAAVDVAGGGGEGRLVEARGGGDAGGGAAGAGQRGQLDVAHGDGLAGGVGGVDAGEELVFHRGPDDGAGLLQDGLGHGAADAEAGEEAGLEVAALDHLGVVAVIGGDVEVEAVVVGAHEGGGADFEGEAGERDGGLGEVAHRGLVADAVGIGRGGRGVGQDVAADDLKAVLEDGPIDDLGGGGGDQLVAGVGAEAWDLADGEQRGGVALVEHEGLGRALGDGVFLERDVLDGAAKIGEAHGDKLVGQDRDLRVGAVLDQGGEGAGRRGGGRGDRCGRGGAIDGGDGTAVGGDHRRGRDGSGLGRGLEAGADDQGREGGDDKKDADGQVLLVHLEREWRAGAVRRKGDATGAETMRRGPAPGRRRVRPRAGNAGGGGRRGRCRAARRGWRAPRSRSASTRA